MNGNIIQPDDHRYFVAKPDPSFSPQRNKAIIQETIKETEKFFKDLEDKLDDGIKERIDIVGTYARYRFSKGTKNFDDYAGKRLRDQLIGEKVLEKVRVMKDINKTNGNDKYQNFILK